jgi:hypothetical protein
MIMFLTTIFAAVFVAVFAIASLVADVATARRQMRRKIAEIAALDSGNGQRWNVRRS